MSSSDKGKKDYDVGYGKPPKHTQWQKGQSGNPSGKKKTEDSFIDKVKKIASEELVVHKGGVPQSMSYLDAAIYALFAKAQNGNPQAFKILADQLGKDTAEAMTAGSYAMADADLSALKTSADWYALLEQAQSENAPETPDDQNDGDVHDDDATEPH